MVSSVRTGPSRCTGCSLDFDLSWDRVSLAELLAADADGRSVVVGAARVVEEVHEHHPRELVVLIDCIRGRELVAVVRE